MPMCNIDTPFTKIFQILQICSISTSRWRKRFIQIKIECIRVGVRFQERQALDMRCGLRPSINQWKATHLILDNMYHVHLTMFYGMPQLVQTQSMLSNLLCVLPHIQGVHLNCGNLCQFAPRPSNSCTHHNPHAFCLHRTIIIHRMCGHHPYGCCKRVQESLDAVAFRTRGSILVLHHFMPFAFIHLRSICLKVFLLVLRTIRSVFR